MTDAYTRAQLYWCRKTLFRTLHRFYTNVHFSQSEALRLKKEKLWPKGAAISYAYVCGGKRFNILGQNAADGSGFRLKFWTKDWDAERKSR